MYSLQHCAHYSSVLIQHERVTTLCPLQHCGHFRTFPLRKPAILFMSWPALGLALLRAISRYHHQHLSSAVIWRSRISYAHPGTLQPPHSLMPVTFPHRSQHFLPNFSVGILCFPNVPAIFSALRSQSPPDLQIGTTVSHTKGSNSAVAPSPGLSSGIAEWKSSRAGFWQTWHSHARHLRISSLWRSMRDVRKLPVASGLGSGSREGGRLQSERGARSEYSKGYARPSGVGLPHMTM